MLKDADDVRAALAARYEKTWAEEAAGAGDTSWPWRVALGSASKAELEDNFLKECSVADRLIALAAELGLEVEFATRVVGGTRQLLPSHMVVPNMRTLARATGNREAYARSCARAERLARDFPDLGERETARLLSLMRRRAPDAVDFDLACRAGAWFRENDAVGLTARQVPLTGFHAKWLDAAGRRSVVAELAGLDDLPLVERPMQVRFTYLDPKHLAAGGRRHDSWVAGDVCPLAYGPDVIVICENRDSALWFPQVEGGISIQGDGFSAIRSLPMLGWVREAPLVVYWGDMDAAGLEILSACREAGIACESMLMDMGSYERYRTFGTNVDKRGRPLSAKVPLGLPGLRLPERELYLRLVDASCNGPRRIEQERIPLLDAFEVLLRIMNERLL